MKVVILAGGYGTRLSEYTDLIPKPMVKIGRIPILLHIMNIYSYFGHKEFYIATGYKSHIIKKYFNLYLKNKFNIHNKINKNHDEYYIKKNNWKINLINTGIKTMTGGRLKRLKKFIQNESFLLTYGDGLFDVNINKLIKFHKINKKIISLTAVRPPARFGALQLKGNKVISFREKSKMDVGWINGGFFIIKPEFLNYIKNDSTFLEREPLEKVANDNQLFAYKHEGFWQCMDTKRDRDYLESLVKLKNIPWIKNKKNY